tara:strand:+ start:2009 stop:3685 length:1677 start_codon:yes stop_codon:yes gene_type:complete
MPQSGTYLQLNAAFGSEDIYLTGNPQMTFFKSVYKKHTNFAMDTAKIKIPKSELKYTTTTTCKVKLDRNGDLANTVYIGLTLPAIFSNSTYKFQWVKYIGNNIISKVGIYINGLKIDEQYGEWMLIWNELNLTDDKKKIYYDLIGHTPELYDPAHAYSRNGFYPDSALDANDKLNYNKPPSIPEKVIYVPLNFWFCRNTGLALPLIALQTSLIEFEIEFQPIYKLYTVLNSSGKRIQPDISNNLHHIKNFLSETYYLPTPRLDIGDWDFKAHLEVTYIYLDKEERRLFASKPHDYLIQTITKITESNLNPGNINIKIKASHPTTEIIIVGQRSDSLSRNDYNNYTNWENNDKPPWQGTFLPEFNKIAGNIEISENSYWKALEAGNTIRLKRDSVTGALVLEKYVISQYIEIGRFDTSYETNPALPSQIVNNPVSQTYVNNTKHIINKMNILLDGNRKIDDDVGRDNEFFSKLQVYQHHKGNPLDGILIYSFAISPEDTLQPSGYCNLTKIQNLLLQLKTVEPLKTNGVYNYKFNFNIYLISYNIFSVLNGQGGLKFAT